jgi:hypothetical protein
MEEENEAPIQIYGNSTHVAVNAKVWVFQILKKISNLLTKLENWVKKVDSV